MDVFGEDLDYAKPTELYHCEFDRLISDLSKKNKILTISCPLVGQCKLLYGPNTRSSCLSHGILHGAFSY